MLWSGCAVETNSEPAIENRTIATRVIILFKHHTGNGRTVTSSNSVPHDTSAIPCSHETQVRCAKGPNSKGQPTATRIPLAALCGIETGTGENVMKIKGLVFISCLAAGALIASPALSKPAKKPASSSSRSQQTAGRTTQVTSRNRSQLNRQNVSSHTGSTRRQYSGTHYYSGIPRYRANTYYELLVLHANLRV